MILCLLSLLLGARYGIHCFWRGLGSLCHHCPLLPVFLPSSFHEWAITDKVFRAAAMIAVPFICLGILHCTSQLDHEFFHQFLDSIGVVLTIMCIFFFLPIAPGTWQVSWGMADYPSISSRERSWWSGVWMDHLLLGSWGFETIQLNPPFQPPWWP